MHRNILFDLDQTLLDFHATEHLALKVIIEQNGQVFTEALYDFFKQTNKNLWLEYEKKVISRSELFETRFRRLFEKCGCNTDEMDIAKINSDFIDIMSQNGVLMDDAVECLKRIKDNIPDARMYVITNGATRNALGRIASTGLDSFLSGVFVSESMGAAKPSVEYFDMVREAIGEPDERYIVIGDSLTSDMLGAKNAGLTSCWFMPSGDIAGALKGYAVNYTAASFDELFDVIMKWSAAL